MPFNNVQQPRHHEGLTAQQDYEIDYAYLSGGERTAVALAYRLALNQVINKLMSKIKTRDLVILDEPTDGFSTNQLDKIRKNWPPRDFQKTLKPHKLLVQTNTDEESVS